MKNVNRLWLVALALGWLFDFLFWDTFPGISFALFALACLLAGIWLLRAEGTHFHRRTALLFAPFAFFALVSAVRAEPAARLMNFWVSLLLLMLITVTYRGGRWPEYSLSDYIARFLHLLGNMAVRPLIFFAERRRAQEEAGTLPDAKKFWKRSLAILRGLLLSLPLLLLFGALLSEADPIFAARLKAIIDIFAIERLPEYLFRGFYILLFAYLIGGALLYAAEKSQEEKLLGEEKPLVPRFLGFTETGVVLGLVEAMFALFVAVQFQYFFGGQANVTAQGYTFAEYARRGFGELVAVALFSLLMFLGLSAIARRENDRQQRIFSVMGSLLVGLVLVMLISAYQRLTLYEGAYGFTRTRTYTHVFMFWLGALLLAFTLLEWRAKTRTFALIMLLAVVGFAVSINVLNVDVFIVRQNVAHVTGNGRLDVSYLSSLSGDAVPALIDAWQHAKLSPMDHAKLGASLSCQAEIDGLYQPDQRPWQAFVWGDFRARKAWQQIKPALAEYHTARNADGLWITNVMGKSTECWQLISTGWD